MKTDKSASMAEDRRARFARITKEIKELHWLWATGKATKKQIMRCRELETQCRNEFGGVPV